MNRTTFRKFLYPILLLALFSGLAALAFSGRISNRALFGIALGLLLLGRIINYPLRHFYRGLRAFQQQQLEPAEQLFQRFLQDLERRPWIRHLIWWSFGMYTSNLEAMTYNNLGAIRLRQGEFEAAQPFLQKAIALDPQYAKPYFNLAIAAAGLGQREQSGHYFQQAQALGYSGGSFDQFLTAVQEEYALVNAKLS